MIQAPNGIRALVPFAIALLCGCSPYQAADVIHERPNQAPRETQKPRETIKGVPSSLSEKLNRILTANYDSIPMAAFADTFHVVRLSDTVQVFCFRVRYGAMQSDFLCLAFNQRTQHTSPAAIKVAGQWMSDAEKGFPPSLRLMTKGVLSSQSYRGRKLMCLSERQHNGTVYNAVVDHYFDVTSALELSPVISVEARCKLPLEGSWYIDRSLSDLAIQSVVTDEVGHTRTLVGQFYPGSMIQADCYQPEYCRYVISCSGSDTLPTTWMMMHP